MAKIPSLILFILVSFSITNTPSSASLGDKPTVYEVLESYDFPVGLLPKGVVDYELDATTGKFSVKLNGTCTFSIDSYELKYLSTITGVISKDKLSDLSGIKVKVLILWLNIVKVTREDDELDFSVGIASADFPVSNFVESPTCGCGFDCVTANIDGMAVSNGSVTSSSRDFDE
ncbi:hypothetical protein FNV43_RR23559 [Rhamnella rubrinervis]|uniref:Uncharacterized protein n=1 Tax=Rhamnella rubrinervis TaxID=2594499 RepID=A0A8K0GPA1_9ROSA|nr:hypothetical protein FNV43_RR23559 [Rhamnella rubrinervis]